MKAARWIGVLLLLSGCGSSQPLFTGDGRLTQLIRCSAAEGWPSCDARAQAQCGDAGYDTLQRNRSDGTLSMLIACKRLAAAY
ncbi:hypothetical protein KQH49_08025 [Mycetohabitans sp. B5]|uniref:Lipoprotein n=1 Tax=Mycetohabitans endofungorum TaxID=417203 RepID=A0A2P5KAS9_9BURK|nr:MULTISPECIES: hypothetical protein [Mycetohabitans]MCG1054901.1 hypothetical protein [Mycetohabitans sp. B5]PPB83800.1 hypothetical protein B0O95_106191 [Mycetohabitans endofungorum]